MIGQELGGRAGLFGPGPGSHQSRARPSTTLPRQSEELTPPYSDRCTEFDTRLPGEVAVRLRMPLLDGDDLSVQGVCLGMGSRAIVMPSEIEEELLRLRAVGRHSGQ